MQKNLRWACDRDTADRICNFNRHYAEHSGYFEKTNFIDDAKVTKGEINFYDSNTGKLLFTAPKGRTMEQFLLESRRHGAYSVCANCCCWSSFSMVGKVSCTKLLCTAHRLAQVSVLRSSPSCLECLLAIVWLVPYTVLLTRFPLSTNSFRDEEVNWENVRILPDGEAVSVFGTRK